MPFGRDRVGRDMVDSRTATALVGLAASLAISVAAWVYFDSLLLFLFVPFVPFLLRRGGERADRPQPATCPTCGFRTPDPDYTHCPLDGTPLER